MIIIVTMMMMIHGGTSVLGRINSRVLIFGDDIVSVLLRRIIVVLVAVIYSVIVETEC